MARDVAHGGRGEARSWAERRESQRQHVVQMNGWIVLRKSLLYTGDHDTYGGNHIGYHIGNATVQYSS